jgi:ankyrin repeat protein
MFGQVDMISLLLANAADPEIIDYDGKTPLQIAQASGKEDIARLLSGSSTPVEG